MISVHERAARVRLLLFDVDGVLTDGTVIVHSDGSESKGFHIRDGAALVWAQRTGLTVGLLSARSRGLLARPDVARACLCEAPADGARGAVERAHWVSPAAGGRGAVCVFIEMVLRAQNKWDAFAGTYGAGGVAPAMRHN